MVVDVGMWGGGFGFWWGGCDDVFLRATFMDFIVSWGKFGPARLCIIHVVSTWCVVFFKRDFFLCKKLLR